MNNIKNSDVLIKPIKNPTLSDTGFANGIDQMISNINENFAILANHDFIKGDTGSSVKIIESPIFDENKEITDPICIKLKDFISSFINIETDRYIDNDEELDYFNNFKEDNAGSLYLIYNIDENTINTNSEPISSLQYIFLDGRFWNNKIGMVDNSLYEGIEDKSCVIVYDKNIGGFKSLNNAFPTIYYESGIGFCWKLNGKTTGIPVQGVPGKDGLTSLLRIVKVNELSQVNGFDLKSAEVIKIFESFSGWIDIDKEYINDYSNSSVLIIDNSNKIYFGITSMQEDKLIATCDPSISLNDITTNISIKHALRNLNLNESNINTGNLQGIFIPIEHPENETDPQKSHLISASSIISADNLYTKNDVIFTPVKDNNSLDITEEKPLQVDKYLYVRFNPESGLLNNVVDTKNLSTYNYYLKYKLTAIVENEDDEILKPTNDNFTSLTDKDGNVITINISNVSYKIPNNQASLNYKDSIMVDFNKHKLYVWEICNEKNVNYDIDELLECSKDSNSYTNIPSWLKRICTTTFTPAISSEILWFNGIDILEYPYLDTPVVPGWNNTLAESPFEFIKFVPVFNDKDFHVNDDTAINFNYNVNITGCDHEGSNVKHNLTVHGDVNCDNINVYRLTATGEISNVYTKNNIVTEKGLITPGIIIGEDSNITGVKELSADFINTNNITTKEISTISEDNSGNILTNNLSVICNSNDLLNINSTSDSKNTDNEFIYKDSDIIDIKVNNTRSIDLNKTSIKLENDGYIESDYIVPKISTNIPIVATEKSSIVITTDSANNAYVDQNISKDLHDNLLKWKNSGVFMAGTTNSDAYKSIDLDANNYDSIKMLFTEQTRNLTEAQTTSTSVSQHNLLDYVNAMDRIFWKNLPEKIEDKTFITNDLIEHPLCKFTISKRDSKESFYLNPITINLSQYNFGMGLYAHCSYGSWPMIMPDSKLNLNYKISIYSNSNSVTPLKEYTYTASTYSFNNTEKEWSTGVLKDGTSVKDSDYSSWRYKSYTFNPKTITINSSSTLKDIKECIDNGGTVEITVYPKLTVHVKSSKNNRGKTHKVVDDLEILKLVSTGKNSTQSGILTVDSKYNVKNSSYRDDISKLSYNVSSLSDNESYSTVLCNNGIVIKASNSVFGLGYSTVSKEPELYYYQKTDDSNKGTSKQISLGTLFEKLSNI